MNINTTKFSNSKSQSSVVSKYFSRDRVMDDSLTDFKEKKSATKGPKTVKPSTSKPKKKVSKKIKGQKDIRTALKAKKNELIDYTKQFDDVCKVSGLDVETEQLLLAVALSKSLQKTDDTTEDNSPSSSQSSQGRINKIRTTLQQYGFTVPEIKISKKSRVCKKSYKLLLSTESEKQQIISDKYAQVLFDVCNHKLVEDKGLNDTNIKLYNKATNIPYKDIRDNNVFYVLKSLVEKSSSVGSLLRNWSDIPGRPSSPVYCDYLNMDFSEIECSQEELDVILSGSLKSCKSIMGNKTRRKSISPPTIIVEGSNRCNKELDDFNSEANSNDRGSLNVDTETDLAKERISQTPLSSSVTDKNSVATPSLTRSCSPDIFDDEASGILENNEDSKDIVYTQIIDDIIEDKNKTIDLTHDTDDVMSKSFKCSQNNNFTRRLSNDVMEITECVGRSALSKSDVNNHGRKSLDMNLSNKTDCFSQQIQLSNKTKILNDVMEITDCVASTSVMSRNVSSKANVDLTQDSDEESEKGLPKSCPVSNKSHTPSSDDQLPSIEVESTNNESLDATIILNDDEINKALKPKTRSDSFKDKTLYRDILKSTPNKLNEELKSSQSFFDEFEHDHSDNTTVENIEKSKSVEFEVCDEDENKIDLTQSSDDTIEKSSLQEFKPVAFDPNVMGEKDDVSIDYDEFCNDDLEKSKGNTSKASCSSQQSKVSIIDDNERPTNSNTASEISTQNSIAFEICDQELNYSLNKSRCDVPWVNFGGISVMDDSSKLENSRNPVADVSRMKTRESISSFSKSMSDSFLPIVAIKGTTARENIAIETVPKSTPLKILSKPKTDTESTPVSLLSSEYIIKTDQVTPILDYASMSTPERNRELDKHGLKPFKRKRAVQILTHLYNQTHPLIDSSEEMLSPSKKMRPNHDSPKKCLKSPKENEMVCKKENTNNLYGVTKELPDIADIECSEEDWVFQKREKAKLHSCRVPLHISFHNYVSCRRLLREAILRYEPVNIDDIHKGLVAIGLRYDPKDLLKFMDKKCITVKTADNNARNNKR